MQIRPEYPRLSYGHQLANELVCAWIAPARFVGSMYYHDSSVYGYNGTLTGMDPSSDWGFDGTIGRFAVGGFSNTKYIQLPNISSYFVNQNYAISFWAYASSAIATPAAFTVNGTDDLIIYVGDSNFSNGVRYYWRDVGGNIEYGVSVVGRWVHIVAQSTSATNRELWVDGVLRGVNNTDRSGGGPFSGVRIGNWADDATQDFTGGKVADVLIHGRALALPEIQQLANPDPWIGGLIRPPRRVLWPVATVSAATSYWIWSRQHNSQVIGSGV